MKMSLKITVYESFENSRESVCDGVYFSKVARLQCEDSNFTLAGLTKDSLQNMLSKLAVLKRIIREKSLRSIKVNF